MGFQTIIPHSTLPGKWGGGPSTLQQSHLSAGRSVQRRRAPGSPIAGPVRGPAEGFGECRRARGRCQTSSFPAASEGTLCPGCTPVPDRNRTPSEVQLAGCQPGNRQAAARFPETWPGPGRERWRRRPCLQRTLAPAAGDGNLPQGPSAT